MGRPSRFSPEVRERSVRMVEEHREAHASEWAALQSVAPKLGCTAETLRKCVRQAQRDAGHRPGLLTSEQERWTALEREVREIFYTLTETKILIERWRREYNTVRPHSALGYRPPAPGAISPAPLSSMMMTPALS